MSVYLVRALVLIRIEQYIKRDSSAKAYEENKGYSIVMWMWYISVNKYNVSITDTIIIKIKK